MKLRIKGPSVRLRLSQTEVRTLAATSRCAEATPLPGGTFTYTLQTGPAYAAHLDGSTLTVQVPEAVATAWAESDQVSLSSTLVLEDDTEVKLLIEKDFQCLAPDRDEDESDLFPNPNPHC